MESLTRGSSESGIRLSSVDIPMCGIATTCCRVRSVSSGISGQILEVFFSIKNPSWAGRFFICLEYSVKRTNRQLKSLNYCNVLKLTEVKMKIISIVFEIICVLLYSVKQKMKASNLHLAN